MADARTLGLVGIQNVQAGKTRSTITPTLVGVSPSKILLNNPMRLGLLMINTSVNNIFILPSADVSAVNGILLIPNGGAFNTKSWEDYALTLTQWYAVAAGAGSTLMIVETQKDSSRGIYHGGLFSPLHALADDRASSHRHGGEWEFNYSRSKSCCDQPI